MAIDSLSIKCCTCLDLVTAGSGCFCGAIRPQSFQTTWQQTFVASTSFSANPPPSSPFMPVAEAQAIPEDMAADLPNAVVPMAQLQRFPHPFFHQWFEKPPAYSELDIDLDDGLARWENIAPSSSIKIAATTPPPTSTTSNIADSNPSSSLSALTQEHQRGAQVQPENGTTTTRNSSRDGRKKQQKKGPAKKTKKGTNGRYITRMGGTYILVRGTGL